MRYDIKSLEWKYDAVSKVWLADTTFGFFTIYADGTVKFMTDSNFPDWHMVCENVDSAKINAWIYWVERLRTTLNEVN